MKFLGFLEGLRTPFFDAFFSLVTHLGAELVFLVIALLVFWCMDKRRGYYLLVACLFGTVINQTLKLFCRVPRPFANPDFTAVESAIEGASGYSFPSGHTQNATATFGILAITTDKKPMRAIYVILIILVAFSRMYLGVHTPYDVGFSLVFASALIIALYSAFKNEGNFMRAMPYFSLTSPIAALGFLIYAFSASDVYYDAANLLSARENAVTLFSLSIGLLLVYFLDSKYIKFRTQAKWYANILKFLGGIAILLFIKVGGGRLFSALLGNELAARALCYFLIVIFAGVIWPMTFAFFERMRIGFLDSLFTEKTK